jgi:predicted small lipoprotein YifL
MRVVIRMSAIVAALTIVTAGALSGCGQRGALYLPTVPPLPPKPGFQTDPAASNAEGASGASAAKAASAPEAGTVPDTSGTPLSLSPETDLHNAPASSVPASDTTPVQ